MGYRDAATGEYTPSLRRVRYSHEAMIDLIIADPGITQRDIAAHFGYTEAWISTILNSDAFQAALQERRREVTDPVLLATVNERLRAVADLSLQRVLEKLERPASAISDDFLIKSANLATTALGYGAKAPPGTNVGVIIQMPGVAPDAASWAARYSKEAPAIVEEVQPVLAKPRVDHEDPEVRANGSAPPVAPPLTRRLP